MFLVLIVRFRYVLCTYLFYIFLYILYVLRLLIDWKTQEFNSWQWHEVSEFKSNLTPVTVKYAKKGWLVYQISRAFQMLGNIWFFYCKWYCWHLPKQSKGEELSMSE